MIERNSRQEYGSWTVQFGAAFVLIVVAIESHGFCSVQSALGGESQRRPPKTQSLPGDLVAVADANYALLEGLAPGSREAQDRQREAVRQVGLPLEVKTRKAGIVFRLIPAGRFMMGSPSSESGRGDDETLHREFVPFPFYCAKFELTNGQARATLGKQPDPDDELLPTYAPWAESQKYLEYLCEAEGVPKGTYRFLTETEWEYACRAGTQTAFCYGDDLDSSMANIAGDAPYGKGSKTNRSEHVVCPVGKFRPNAWGLYDMHGNVIEWCDSWYDPGNKFLWSGPFQYGYRVVRGGGYPLRNTGVKCRSACRFGMSPVGDLQIRPSMGLRIARTIMSLKGDK